MHAPPALFVTLAILTSCSSGSDKDDSDTSSSGSESQDTGPDDDGDTREQGEDTTVTVFDAEHVYYGAENRRSVDVEVTFPDSTRTYSALNGRFRLHCPNDYRCDHWDRYGTFGVVLNAGEESEQFVEIDRFITAYRVGFSWESDLTDVRPLLTDTVTLRVFIDTWVGPGHEAGDGWLFDAAIDFEGGPPPSPEPIDVVPVWGHSSWSAGLPDNPVEAQIPSQTVSVPDATRVTFRSFITGHGWNNSANCAEFCSKSHYYTVGGTEFGREVWRDDCRDTVTDGTQMGTWEYSRAGWCPGAQVFPWDTEVTESLTEGEPVDVSYRLEDYIWAGDGDQPYYYMSGVLVAYQ